MTFNILYHTEIQRSTENTPKHTFNKTEVSGVFLHIIASQNNVALPRKASLLCWVSLLRLPPLSEIVCKKKVGGKRLWLTFTSYSYGVIYWKVKGWYLYTNWSFEYNKGESMA